MFFRYWRGYANPNHQPPGSPTGGQFAPGGGGGSSGAAEGHKGTKVGGAKALQWDGSTDMKGWLKFDDDAGYLEFQGKAAVDRGDSPDAFVTHLRGMGKKAATIASGHDDSVLAGKFRSTGKRIKTAISDIGSRAPGHR